MVGERKGGGGCADASVASRRQLTGEWCAWGLKGLDGRGTGGRWVR